MCLHDFDLVSKLSEVTILTDLKLRKTWQPQTVLFASLNLIQAITAIENTKNKPWKFIEMEFCCSLRTGVVNVSQQNSYCWWQYDPGIDLLKTIPEIVYLQCLRNHTIVYVHYEYYRYHK